MSVGTQLKLLGLNVLVLSEIAASVALVNHIVRFKSGIDNNSTLRRMWSKPDAVIFQPVFSPLLLSLVVCLGINCLARSIMIGFLQIIDAVRVTNELSWSADFAVTVTGTLAGALSGTIIYILNGGSILFLQIAGALALSLFVSLTSLIGEAAGSYIAISIVSICVITIGFSLWVSKIVGSKVHTQQVRELRPTLKAIASNHSKLHIYALILGCIVLLIALRLCDLSIFAYTKTTDVYLSFVLRNFSGLMVLISCSFTAILLTNVSIMNSFFVWQWPCVFLPMIALLPVEIALQAFLSKEHSQPFLHTFTTLVKRTTMYAASGYLGGTFYLGVLARAANIALDPGFEDHSELILDDDSDYEIDA